MKPNEILGDKSDSAQLVSPLQQVWFTLQMKLFLKVHLTFNMDD